jgi:redox-sensitive bicupin YhaK (pirin superfamily)
MDVIHFTHGATDPLISFGAAGVRFLPLVDGPSECHVSCAHLDAGAKIPAPSQTHAAALLVVHGKVTVWTDCRVQLSGGMGAVLAEGEAYRLETDTGAIILIVESTELTAHRRGISSPERIAGQTWPGDGKKD